MGYVARWHRKRNSFRFPPCILLSCKWTGRPPPLSNKDLIVEIRNKRERQVTSTQFHNRPNFFNLSEHEKLTHSDALYQNKNFVQRKAKIIKSIEMIFWYLTLWKSCQSLCQLLFSLISGNNVEVECFRGIGFMQILMSFFTFSQLNESSKGLGLSGYYPIGFT